MLHFHRVNLQIELPTSSPLIKPALKGVARSHVVAGTTKRVRRPISWDALLGGQDLAPSWGPGGRMLWLSLALGYFLVARSDEIFASPTGVVHPVHCVTRGDVALYAGGRRWPRCSGTRPPASRFGFEAIKATRPNRGRLLYVHAMTPGGAVRGRSWRRRRRSHGGIVVGLSDIAGKPPFVVVSVR